MISFASVRDLILRKIGLGDAGSLVLMRRLIEENFRPQAKRYAVAFFFMFLSAVTISAWAWLQKDVVNQIFFERRTDLLVPLALAVIILPLFKGLATYGQEIMLSRIGNRIIADIQRRIYDHLLKLGLDFFTERPSSELITRISAGAGAARGALDLVINSVGRDLLMLVALGGVMVFQAPALALVALVIAPLVIVGVTRIVKRVRSLATKEFALAGRIIQIVQETVHGARVIKAFGLAEHQRQQMFEATAAIEERANKIAQLQARTNPILEAIGGVAMGLTVLYCGWLTLNGTQQPGEFVAFSAALLFAYEPAKRLARLRVNLEVQLVGVKMLYGLLDTPPAATEVSDGPEFRPGDGSIVFEGVSFAYRRGTPVLRDVSFTVPPNTKAALVGPSGAGKTTILSLIPRLYALKTGRILVDGQDIAKVTPDSLRAAMAMVSQDTFLFGGNIMENIRVGRPSATDAEVEQAARDAFAHDFIMELPKGYDTAVGENGVQLSGGQRQRIAIARAILKQAPILLLDEATSSLDSQSEKNIQMALDRLMQDRTTIVIAHRLSTILNAQRIFVIDEGRVVEEGTHRELLARGGLYRRLYEHQFADLPRESLLAPPPLEIAG